MADSEAQTKESYTPPTFEEMRDSMINRINLLFENGERLSKLGPQELTDLYQPQQTRVDAGFQQRDDAFPE